MLFEQQYSQELLTPTINDGGVHDLKSSLSSFDFYLLDDINVYLSPVQAKATTNDLNNDSKSNNSQHQEELFSDLDLIELNEFEEKSDFIVDTLSIDDLDIEKWISQSSFPSPSIDTTNSSLSNVEDTSSIFPSMDDEHANNMDMIVPSSPSLSSTDSSSILSKKKQKLSAIERKLRKKDQNKTAAEKYRLKKKSERDQLTDRHSKLKTTNMELKLELENLTFRIQEFKKLFVDVLQIEPSILN